MNFIFYFYPADKMNLPPEIWCKIMDSLDYSSLINIGEAKLKSYWFICGYVIHYRKNEIAQLNGIYPHNRYSSVKLFLKQLSRIFDLITYFDKNDLFKQVINQAVNDSKIIIKDNKFAIDS